jgi:hypothetical protein
MSQRRHPNEDRYNRLLEQGDITESEHALLMSSK